MVSRELRAECAKPTARRAWILRAGGTRCGKSTSLVAGTNIDTLASTGPMVFELVRLMDGKRIKK